MHYEELQRLVQYDFFIKIAKMSGSTPKVCGSCLMSHIKKTRRELLQMNLIGPMHTESICGK